MRKGVIKGREKGGRKLAREFEHLARGEREPRPPSRPRLSDPRPVALVPGVKNSDARLVFSTRIESLKELQSSGNERDFLIQLAETIRIGAWRGGSLTSLDAMLENTLELDPNQIRNKLEETGLDLEPASDESIALCMRAEAVLRADGARGRAFVIGRRPHEEIAIRVATADAPASLELIGRRAAALMPRRSGSFDRNG